MLTFPCPWCDHELVVPAPAQATGHVRCEACATVVDLAPQPVVSVADTLPLAA